ncbi:MAG: FAD-binding oxidoreductase [Candidatus Rokubacteria bacterium]|nr:FAD-binding oxidoreductase [Candidatus Rokubacteria bacterium]
MAVTARSIAGALLALLGPEGLSDDDASRARAAVDGLVPRWVARPASLEQVCGVLALAHDAELAVVPRGSGSSLELGHPPARADLVLDLRGLDRVLEWSPDDLTVTVEAGITAGALARRLDARRQLLPLDPPGAGARTLGGLAATNASGPLRARYGTLRDLLLGVRFVQADGVLTWGGAKVVKSVSGYDVPKLMIGALGTLGVLGELTLRLHPRPEAEGAWLVTAARPADAQAFVVALLDSPLQPNRVELLDGAMLGACGLGPAAAAVAVGIGSVADAVRAQGEAVVALARRAGSTVAPTPEDFWARYEREATRGDVRLRVATGVDGLAAALDALARADAGARAGGCAALGLLDVALGVAEPPAVAAVVARLRELVAPAGGGVVVQRAPRAVRAALDPWGPVDAGPLALMRGLKDAFDPRRVLNPGRFVGGL